jgi:hypothetical protein
MGGTFLRSFFILLITFSSLEIFAQTITEKEAAYSDLAKKYQALKSQGPDQEENLRHQFEILSQMEKEIPTLEVENKEQFEILEKNKKIVENLFNANKDKILNQRLSEIISCQNLKLKNLELSKNCELDKIGKKHQEVQTLLKGIDGQLSSFIKIKEQLAETKKEVMAKTREFQKLKSDSEKKIKEIDQLQVQLHNEKKDLENLRARTVYRDNFECSENTKTINLEEEELKHLKHDHQNGLNTCYANVAKILLYPETKIDASFLDLAFINKREEAQSLDWGITCAVIERANQLGLCQKQNSIFESDGRFGTSQESTGKFLQLYEAMKSYINNQDGLTAEDKSFLEDLAGKGQQAQSGLGFSSSHIEKLRHIDKQLYSLAKNKDTVPEKFFSSLVAKRKEELLIKIIENEKRSVTDKRTQPQIFQEVFADVFKSYGIDFNAELTNPFYLSMVSQYEIKRGMDELKKREDFWHLYQNKINPDGKDLDTNVCTTYQLDKTLPFMAFLELNQKMTELGLTTEKQSLIKEKNSYKDLFYQTMMPACLTQRIFPQSPLKCNELSATSNDATGKAQLRQQVLEHLISKPRRPIGFSSNRHISTITGHRRNPETKKCEFLLRDSLAGGSSWVAEQQIMDRVEYFTIIEKKYEN